MMSFSPPASKMARLSSEKQVGDLADADLAEIFKHLPLYDRLILSEVCRRWRGLSRAAWLDVKQLDLSSIPGANINAIIKQCPNLQSVVSLNKSFGLNELASLVRSRSLSTVKLYDCKCAVESDYPDVVNDGFAKLFSADLQHASWNELVLHDVHVTDDSDHWSSWAFSAAFLPASLTRLQLSGLRISGGSHCENMFLFPLQRLPNLECFILHDAPDNHDRGCDDYEDDDSIGDPLRCENLFAVLCRQKNLKELCVCPGEGDFFHYSLYLRRLIACLPKLEVLVLTDISDPEIVEDLKQLITTRSALRILVLAGRFRRLWHGGGKIIDISARKRFPHGFEAYPLPLLHIFLGNEASKHIRFTQSAADAAIVHSIDQPMPKFLEREDIAEIFKGVWIAAKIKETAEFGGELWCYQRD